MSVPLSLLEYPYFIELFHKPITNLVAAAVLVIKTLHEIIGEVGYYSVRVKLSHMISNSIYLSYDRKWPNLLHTRGGKG
ncbi:hypothetical protein SAMN05443253_107311 [Bacillus sp. OK048]|nr:hypothetical protein SAMN05443253_107311 [Bacillus sp. OK048]